MKNVIRKSSHGGKREGSGAKKGRGFYGKPVSVKLSESLHELLEFESKRQKKTVSELIRKAVYEKYHPMAEYTK